ncbi:MAG: 2-amino-4-hydroxy-6-hydroxymethyldihydropteridine diphosphokinase [Pseudomonadota bacterium]
MKNNTVYIAIGSNLSDKIQNCKSAIDLLEKSPSIEVLAKSYLYRSKALTCDGIKKPDYVNCAIKISTSLNPLELLKLTQLCEEKLGRKPSDVRWESRMIDLDILLFNDDCISTDVLKIPHPEMDKRLFVIKPMCDIAHPELGIRLSEILSRLEKRESIECLD